MDVRYTYRLRPGQSALAYLSREWGACRWVWNQLVAESRLRHSKNQAAKVHGRVEDVSSFGYAEQNKFLTHLRHTTRDPETGELWLSHGSCVAQQQVVRDFAAARSKALMDRKNKIPMSKRRGLPSFKSRHTSLPSMNYTTRGFSLKPHPKTGRLALALPGGKVLIPVVWSRDLPSVPTSARVYQDSLGDWYVSFVVKLDDETQHLPRLKHTEVIGIDWGVTETATTATVDIRTGEVDEAGTFDLSHKEHGKRAARGLARYQRMMARRKTPRDAPNTKGYEKARKRAAKVYKKVARQRQDDAHKWARNLVQHHDRIAVEDFKPKFLARSTMGKKAADAAIAATKAELLWQAKKAGRDLRLVHPAHTTTDCSNCGARTKHSLPLGERVYACERCGMVRSRDKNSAAIMVDRAGFVPADVEDVSPEPAAVREPAV